MKTKVLVCAVFMLGARAIRADLTVVQQVDVGGDGHMESTYRFKGGKTRVDAFRGTSLVMDLQSGVIISFNQNTKTYFKEVFSAVTPPTTESSNPAQTGPADTKPMLTSTGRKDTISGFRADEYVGIIAGAKTALWFTKALPNYETVVQEMKHSSQGPLGTLSLSAGMDMTDLPGFPIRIVLEPQPGQTGSRLTVVSVSTEPVADSEFEIPAGYKEMVKPVLTPPAAVEPLPLPSPSR